MKTVQVRRTMARKQSDNSPGSRSTLGGGNAANRVADAAPSPEPAARAPKTIFDDTRSGRDRRLDSAPVDDPRRKNPDRRRGKIKGAWWLERDYVESHHFVQTPRSRHHEGDTGG